MAFSFKWRPSAIFDVKKFEIETADPVRRANMRHQAKFCANRSNSCGDKTFFNFSRWQRPPYWVFKVDNFTYRSATEGQYASPCQISCRFVERLRRWPIWDFAWWRPSAILDLFYLYFDHPRWVFVGLCHYVRFGWNRCSSFDNMPVLKFCEFGLKMSIHAFFGWFLVIWPLDGKQYQPISQRLNLRVTMTVVMY